MPAVPGRKSLYPCPMINVGTPSVLFLTVKTRVPGLRPGQISLMSKLKDLTCAQLILAMRQESPQSLSGAVKLVKCREPSTHRSTRRSTTPEQ